MSDVIKVEIFDERRCLLGEGPISYGDKNNSISWVDILNKRVYSRTIDTGITQELQTDDDVSFIIPRTDGGFILGTTYGPVSAGPDLKIPILNHEGPHAMRFNDAKVSPDGDLWFGTMSYEEIPEVAGLYCLRSDDLTISKKLSQVSISNGTVWSSDESTMYFIDSPTRSIWVFNYDGENISDKRLGIRFPDEFGFPDGMTIDAEGGLWVAFWMGNAVRRFDPANNFSLTATVLTPAKRTTSCVFGGENLDQLIITSSHSDDPQEPHEAGMTFICKPGFVGLPTERFKVGTYN